MDGKIVTNDVNLNKVARLHGHLRPQHQRAGQRPQARRPARRADAGLHHQGRQGEGPGRGLSRRRHDGRRRQLPPADRPEHRRHRHLGPADDGRQDDLRPLQRRDDEPGLGRHRRRRRRPAVRRPQAVRRPRAGGRSWTGAWPPSTPTPIVDSDRPRPGPIPSEGGKYAARYPKIAAVVRGGARRQDSVANGVRAGRRPRAATSSWSTTAPGRWSTQELISGSSRRPRETGAAVPVVPVDDTIKEAEDGRVVRTLDRSRLFRVQTPQGFALGLLQKALERARAERGGGTDEASLVERLGLPVAVVAGRPAEHQDHDAPGPDHGGGFSWTTRIGLGYDLHRLAEGRRLVLGGVEIPLSAGSSATPTATSWSTPSSTRSWARSGKATSAGSFPTTIRA